MRAFRSLVTVFLAACFFAGCASTNNTSYPSQSPLNSSEAAAGCAGYFEARSENVKDGVGQWHRQLFAHAVSFANKNPLENSIVTLGNDTIAWNSTSTKENLQSWDREQVWHIATAGSGTVTDSLLSPMIFGVESPKELMNFDSVSKSGGFTVSYTEPGCDSVCIYLRSNQKLAHLFDKNIPSDTGSVVTFLSTRISSPTDDYAVQAKDLAAFPAPGIIQVMVIGQNSKYGMIQGQRYLFRSTSTTMLNTFLKP